MKEGIKGTTEIKRIRFDASERANHENEVTYHLPVQIVDDEKVVQIAKRDDINIAFLKAEFKEMIGEIFDIPGVVYLRIEEYFIQVRKLPAADMLKDGIHKSVQSALEHHIFKDGEGEFEAVPGRDFPNVDCQKSNEGSVSPLIVIRIEIVK